MSDIDSRSELRALKEAVGADTDPVIGTAVGSRLGTLLSESNVEGVPDHLLDLIIQLEEMEQAVDTSPAAEP